LNFSLFSVLAGGASTIANQLDYVMIGMYLGLDEVPVYTMGYFIGTVVAMPMRAMSGIISGIVATKIHSSTNQDLQRLSQNSARVNFLLMASIMAGIWAGFEPFQMLIPAKFRGLDMVFLCIGLSKLIWGLNTSNNSHLRYSEHYRLILPVNLGLVIFTIGTNYLFLVILDMGIAGAALATLGTVVWNSVWRLAIIWRKFQIHPFSWSIAYMALIAIAAGYLFHWEAGALGLPPMVEAIALGTLATGSCLSLFYVLGFFPELRAGIKQRLPWWP
jgi:O-antigen/teichoic acid export membrane protein